MNFQSKANKIKNGINTAHTMATKYRNAKTERKIKRELIDKTIFSIDSNYSGFLSRIIASKLILSVEFNCIENMSTFNMVNTRNEAMTLILIFFFYSFSSHFMAEAIFCINTSLLILTKLDLNSSKIIQIILNQKY